MSMLKLNFEKHLSGAIVVGLFIVIDAIMLLMGYRHFINQIFSMFELLWLFYSLIAGYQMFQSKRAEKTIPLMYVGYYIFSFIVGSYWLIEQGDLNVLPTWYMVFAILFGVYYFIHSIKQLKNMYAENTLTVNNNNGKDT